MQRSTSGNTRLRRPRVQRGYNGLDTASRLSWTTTMLSLLIALEWWYLADQREGRGG